MFDTTPPKDVLRQKDAQLSEKVLQDRAEKSRVKNEQIRLIHIDMFSKLCDIPAPGEQWRIITEKQFNAFDLVEWILRRNVQINEMYVAVYRINEPTVNGIIRLLDEGKISFAVFVISSFFAQTKKPERWSILLRQYCIDHPEKTRHIYVHNHAKVFCCKTSDGGYYVLEGSGNMSDNARIEQYLFEHRELTFNFHRDWILEVCETARNKNVNRRTN